MTNHVHLMLTPTKAEAVPRLIISLGRRYDYVQYINRSYRRTGTLWDSRYKSSVIQAETYLLACQRYIELNPVRAAIVNDPAHYRSIHPPFAREGTVCIMETGPDLLGSFGFKSYIDPDYW